MQVLDRLVVPKGRFFPTLLREYVLQVAVPDQKRKQMLVVLACQRRFVRSSRQARQYGHRQIDISHLLENELRRRSRAQPDSPRWKVNEFAHARIRPKSRMRQHVRAKQINQIVE